MGSPIASEEVRSYFAMLAEQVTSTYAVARVARSRGFDPELDVETPLTDDLASRVERLLENYEVEGVARRIRELAKHNDREELAILVAKEMAVQPAASREKAVERFKEEIPLYKQVQHLQYTPSDEEISVIVSNCPVAINGEGTEDTEISGFRDLPRVETNRIRGGACLVIADGMCLKAPKIHKHVRNLHIDGWEFIDAYLEGHNARPEDMRDELGVEPSEVFIQNIVAGRPVLCHPSRPGGLRLRYGRTRATGLAALALHPATMHILDDFIADLGEILVPFGEFLENNHVLMPGAFSLEWYGALLGAKLGNLPDGWENVDGPQAVAWSRDLGIPLHPRHNLFFHDFTVEELT